MAAATIEVQSNSDSRLNSQDEQLKKKMGEEIRHEAQERLKRETEQRASKEAEEKALAAREKLTKDLKKSSFISASATAEAKGSTSIEEMSRLIDKVGTEVFTEKANALHLSFNDRSHAEKIKEEVISQLKYSASAIYAQASDRESSSGISAALNSSNTNSKNINAAKSPNGESVRSVFLHSAPGEQKTHSSNQNTQTATFNHVVKDNKQSHEFAIRNAAIQLTKIYLERDLSIAKAGASPEAARHTRITNLNQEDGLVANKEPTRSDLGEKPGAAARKTIEAHKNYGIWQDNSALTNPHTTSLRATLLGTNAS